MGSRLSCNVRDCNKKSTADVRYLFEPLELGSLEFKFGVIFYVCDMHFEQLVSEGTITRNFDPFQDDKPVFICGNY